MAFDHRHSRDSRLQGSPQYVPYTQGCTQKLSRIGEWTQVDFVGLLTAGCTRSMHNARQIYRYSGDMHTLFRDWNCAFCHNLDIFFPTLHNDLKHVITTLAQILIGKNALLTHPVVRLGLDNFITIIVLDTRLVDTFVKKKKKNVFNRHAMSTDKQTCTCILVKCCESIYHYRHIFERNWYKKKKNIFEDQYGLWPLLRLMKPHIFVHKFVFSKRWDRSSLNPVCPNSLKTMITPYWGVHRLCINITMIGRIQACQQSAVPRSTQTA